LEETENEVKREKCKRIEKGREYEKQKKAAGGGGDYKTYKSGSLFAFQTEHHGKLQKKTQRWREKRQRGNVQEIISDKRWLWLEETLSMRRGMFFHEPITY